MPRKKADPNATQISKADRFKTAATEKMSKALDSVAKIGLLASTRSHEWTEEQAQRMKAALHNEVDRAMKHFEVTAAKVEGSFSFDTPADADTATDTEVTPDTDTPAS